LENNNPQPGKLEIIAVKSFKESPEMYKIIDFLNKSLKHKQVIFGIKKDDQADTMRITIYET